LPWYALYTNHRQEKKVSEALNQRGIEAYCPVYTTWVQWSDRKKKVDKPLFTSYVFVKLEEKDRDLVFTVSGIVRYVFWLGKPALIKDAEIEQIRIFLKEITPNALITFQPLDPVQIVEGLLKGKSGVVEHIHKHTLVIRLEQLGLSVKAEVAVGDVMKR
jgi:transcriptional antiterminator RfaH